MAISRPSFPAPYNSEQLIATSSNDNGVLGTLMPANSRSRMFQRALIPTQNDYTIIILFKFNQYIIQKVQFPRVSGSQQASVSHIFSRQWLFFLPTLYFQAFYREGS